MDSQPLRREGSCVKKGCAPLSLLLSLDGGGGERRWLKRSPIKKFYAVFSGGFMAGLVGQ